MSTEDSAGQSRPWRRGRALRLAAIGLILLAMVVVFRRPLFFGNLGVVDPGRVYRSAQPDANLDALLDESRPASILNLRGGSKLDDWYVAEVNATRDRDIDFYDLPLSAVRRPTRRELLLLLDLLDRCRYPLLIHCKSGSDRTGLASGLYQLAIRGDSPERALDAFSLAHGHFPIGGPERLHEPFEEYADWLAVHGLSHTPERFRSWVEHDYQADDPLAVVPTLRPGSRWRTERSSAKASITDME